jgi:hypothetical protein
MQWLTLVSEDSGVQRLKADNRKPALARSVDGVAPAPAAPPVRSREHSPATQAPATGERRHDERRSGHDRRRQQVPVLLDTRSTDRRQQPEDNARRPAARKRINLYA